MKFSTFLSICLVLWVSLGCSDEDTDDDECISTGVAYVTTVESPSEGEVNETVDIEIEFPVYNGCGGFGQFLETKSENSITIEVEARYEGCVCTTDIPLITVNYEFITDKAGQYELKFSSSETEFITAIVNIN